MLGRDPLQSLALTLRVCLVALAIGAAPAIALAQLIEPLPAPPPPDVPAPDYRNTPRPQSGATNSAPGGSSPMFDPLNGPAMNSQPFYGDPGSAQPPVVDPIYPASMFPARSDPWDTPSAGLPWVWQFLPEGLVWRSYLAGIKEPRFGLKIANQSGFGSIWDADLGARFSLLRYGTTTAYRPEGFEVQLEGAAQPRLQPELKSTPLVSTDYRIGVPVVYASGPWQFKTGYYHISSHLGDEFMILNPTVPRINYVRDAIMFAVGYYYSENLRLFAEFDYAVGIGGGSRPGEFQFGVDYSPAVRHGAPFFAVYGNLREEVDYGGFFVLQTGWQWRGGAAMHTFRIGVQYFNGQSPQYEFFNTYEQNAGFGIWYDF